MGVKPLLHRLAILPSLRCTVLVACLGCWPAGVGASDASGGAASFEAMTYTLERRGPGTEITYLASHEGSLFAIENVWASADREVPSRLLRKDGPEAPWATDFELPQTPEDAHIVVKPMTEITFEHDYTGAPLAEPVTLLVVGSSRYSLDRETYPFATDLWVRRGPGDWARTVVTEAVLRPCDGSHQPGTRSMAFHYDPVLDREWLFVGTASGQIFRVAYDPDAEGRLAPESEPIFQGSGRVMSLRSTPHGLFASVSLKNAEGDCGVTPGLPEGLFRYQNGTYTVDLAADPAGAFEHLDTWETDARPAEDSCRGLTLLPHPELPGEEALFCGLEDPGHVVFWEGLDGTAPRRLLDFDLIEGLAAMGVPTTPNFRIGPYNELVATLDPATGEPVHLLGLYFKTALVDPDAHLLVRSLDGQYRHVRIPRPDPQGRPLRGVRTVVPSPWPEDGGRTFWFGGFDAHAGPHEGTSWIIRGTIPPPLPPGC